MADDHKTKDYSVGRGKPPKHSQFKPGQSGNPGGRPKGRKRIFMSMLEEINKEISIVENGEIQKVLCGDAIAKRLIANAISKGDANALKLILQLEQQAEDHLQSIQNEIAPIFSLAGLSSPFAAYNSYYERYAEQEAERYKKALAAMMNESYAMSKKAKDKRGRSTKKEPTK